MHPLLVECDAHILAGAVPFKDRVVRGLAAVDLSLEKMRVLVSMITPY